MECASCQRTDFASSLRCQWCGNPLSAGVQAIPASAGEMALHPTSSAEISPPEAAPLAFGAQAAAEQPVILPAHREDVPEKKSLKQLLGPIAAAVFLFLGKFKLLLGTLKLGKLATTFGSMFASIAFYALLFGWKFAIGFVLLIFIHELGHVVALKRRGIPIQGLFFIPFLGAAVAFKKRPRDPAVDAEISWAGPFAGLLGGLGCALLFVVTGNVFWAALAHVTFLLNLINLAPAVPMDGGWIVKAINPKFSLVGSLIGVGLGLYLHSTILVIIAALGAFTAFQSWKDTGDDYEVQKIEPRARLVVTGAYLSLVIVLGSALAYSTHVLHEDKERRQLEGNGALRTAHLGNSHWGGRP